MFKFTSFILSILIVSFLFFSTSNAGASVTHDITGTITLIGKDVVQIKTDYGAVFNLSCTQYQLEDVMTGYRVIAVQKDNRLQSLEIIGIPVEVSPVVMKM